jgi:GGDEF domain-containing protein
MKRLLAWSFPGGVVLAAALAVALGPEGLANALSRGFPWLALGGAVYLSATRHRSRVLAMALGLAALNALVSSGAGGTTAFHVAGGLYFLAVVGLLPFEDRGALSVSGLVQVGAVAVVVVFGGILLYVAPDGVAALLSCEIIPARAGAVSWLVPQPVLGVLAVALPASVAVEFRRRGPVERGACWSIIAVGLTLAFAGSPAVVSVLLGAAGLILGLSVLDSASAWAQRDGLTGLPGRRTLLHDLQAMGGTFAAAMVDIDDFNHLNERYGHDVGDQVLRMVASRLAKVPGGARAYRYGGDEFVLLFPGKTKAEVLEHLGGFRKSLEESPFGLRRWRRPPFKPGDPRYETLDERTPTERLSVRVSIGTADSTAPGAAPEAVLRSADQAIHSPGSGA